MESSTDLLWFDHQVLFSKFKISYCLDDNENQKPLSNQCLGV